MKTKIELAQFVLPISITSDFVKGFGVKHLITSGSNFFCIIPFNDNRIEIIYTNTFKKLTVSPQLNKIIQYLISSHMKDSTKRFSNMKSPYFNMKNEIVYLPVSVIEETSEDGNKRTYLYASNEVKKEINRYIKTRNLPI